MGVFRVSFLCSTILWASILCDNKKTTLKLLKDQLRVTKESHALDVRDINAEIGSIKDELENIAEVINVTYTNKAFASDTEIIFQEHGIQKMVKSLHGIENSRRNCIKNVEILRQGFYSFKLFTTERVKELENMVQTLEGKWTNQRRQLLLEISEINKELNIQTQNIMQNDLSSSVEVFRSEASKSLQDAKDQCFADIKKTEASLAERLSAQDQAIGLIRGRIFPYSDLNDYWFLVFRLRPGDYGGVFEAWTNGVGARESFDPKDADVMFQEHIPFRNYAVDVWERLMISLVRVALFDEDGKEVAFLLFDGTGSDKMNWFSKERLLDSSWGQLRYDSSLNYFSIAGDTGNQRRFFINVRYGSCPIDHGFLLVLDGNAPRPCSYEKRLGQSTQILYSKYPGGIRWSSSDFRKATYMDISIYSNSKGFLRRYRDRSNPL